MPPAQAHFLRSTRSASGHYQSLTLFPARPRGCVDTYWFQPVASRCHFSKALHTHLQESIPSGGWLSLRSKGEPFSKVWRERGGGVKRGQGIDINVDWKQFSGGSLVYKLKKALQIVSCPRVISCDWGQLRVLPINWVTRSCGHLAHHRITEWIRVYREFHL